MTFSYVLGTDIGTVRLFAQDTVADGAFWSDEEIQLALSLALNGNPKRAAAAELMAKAAVDAYETKRVSIAGALSVDGPAGAAQLLAQAKQLLAEADAFDSSAAGSGTAPFDWAEIVTGPFGRRERLRDQALREVG